MSRFYIYDSYTDQVAEFGRKKDERERRRNTMIGAGVAAGGIGTAALAPYAYGGYRSARATMGRGNAALAGLNNARRAAGEVGSAYAQSYKNMGSDIAGSVRTKAGNAYNATRTAAGNAYRSGKASAGRAWNAAKTGSGVGGSNAGLLREPLNRVGNVWKSGKVGKAAILGAVGAAGVAGYRAKKRRDQERNSVKGRVKRLLGR